MRFLIKGKKLKKVDTKTLRQFCRYAARIIKIDDRAALIRIYFVNEKELKSEKDKKELKKYLAWINLFSDNRFTIIINEKVLHRKTRGKIFHLKDAIQCIGHELVHVKQYIKREMRDYANSDVWYKGQRYDKWEEDEDYYFSPWEIEAYGCEEGFYKCFVKRMRINSSHEAI